MPTLEKQTPNPLNNCIRFLNENLDYLLKMRELTHQNLDAFCCTCLVDLIEDPSLTHGKYSIQEKSLEQLIHFCASITSMPVMESIQLPKFVCGICFEKLQSFQEFCYQTIQIFSILSNISKKFNESKATHDQNTASSQNEQAKLDVSEIKVREEIADDDSTVHSNITKSKKIAKHLVYGRQNFGKRDLEGVREAPSENYTEYAIAPEIKIEICEEFEQETPLSDIKIEPSECFDMFYRCRARDKQNDEDFSTNISSSSTSPATHDSGHHIVNEQSAVVCPDFLTNNKSETAANSNLTYLRKLYSCSVCKRRFTYFKRLKIHLLSHKTLKRIDRFECEECGKSFIAFNQLHTHLRKIHGVVLPGYKCPHKRCGKVFNRVDYCEKHQRKHHKPGEKPTIITDHALWDTFELKQST